MKYIKSKIRLDVDFMRDKKGYIAYLKIYPSISSFGKTKIKALKELKIAYKCARKTCKDCKINISGVYNGKK